MDSPDVVFIVGPTGTGKTEAALNLRHSSSIEIINADSRQVYKWLSIGTAKPTLQQQSLVPHHLFDIIEPDGSFSIAQFLEIAREKITEILSRNITPVVVGGTGQYLWGLIEGWQIPAIPPNKTLRKNYESFVNENGSEALYKKLLSIDPGARAIIDSSNTRRIIRALEVWEHTGVPFSTLRKQAPPSYRFQISGININRLDLYKRINDRLISMVENGWVAEIESLLSYGYTTTLPSFSSAGYREIASYIQGITTYEEALEKTKAATHRLVRAQDNWFKKSDSRIAWSENIEELCKRVNLKK
jgi:tRNA dimethylallyltransferase